MLLACSPVETFPHRKKTFFPLDFIFGSFHFGPTNRSLNDDEMFLVIVLHSQAIIQTSLTKKTPRFFVGGMEMVQLVEQEFWGFFYEPEKKAKMD